MEGHFMAIFESNDIAINTNLVAVVGKLKPLPSGGAKFNVLMAGLDSSITFRFEKAADGTAERKRLVKLIDA
jgi:hypothetical protein